MRDTKIINYGEILAANIKEYGFIKTTICGHLKITRVTLNKRLIDGLFTQDQLNILEKKKYI